MAYKQPYKEVNKGKDGASLPFLAAIPAIIKGIAAAGKGIAAVAKAGKGAAAVAKGVKAGKLSAKAAKVTTKAAKAGGKVTKKGKRLLTKAGKITKRSEKAFTKGTKLMEQASNSGKKIDKFSKLSKKATDGTTKIQETIGKAQDKVGDFAGKIADKTGLEKDVVMEKGQVLASSAANAVKDKIAGGGEEPMDPAERGTPSGITPMQSQGGGGYENPEGASMFDHRKNYGPSVKSKYDNVGPSMKPLTITNAEGGNVTYRSAKDGASVDGDGLDKFDIDEDNLFKNSFGDSKLSDFSAPITIKGVTFDAGDAIRLGILGYKGAKKGVEKIQKQRRLAGKPGEKAMRKQDRKAGISKKERTKITSEQNAENKRDARTKPNAKVTNTVLGKTNSIVQSRKKAIEDMKKSDNRRKDILSKKTTPKKNRNLKVVDGLTGIPGAPRGYYSSIPSTYNLKKNKS